MADEKTPPENPNRRDFLTTATSVVAGAGVTAACWPFVSSMNPSSDVLSKSTTEASLKGLRPGDVKTVEWQGKPVFILHRQEKQIAAMEGAGEGKGRRSAVARPARPGRQLLRARLARHGPACEQRRLVLDIRVHSRRH